VAKEVQRGLVKDPSRYGVVITADNEVDVHGTETLRRSMRESQDLLCKELFNRGGSLEQIKESCLQETGLPPPTPPSFRTLNGRVSQMKHIRELHERRKKEDLELYRSK